MNSIGKELRYSIRNYELIDDIWEPTFEWQHEALMGWKRLLILAARQSGKSTISAGRTHGNARFHKAANVIIAPTERHSKETMLKLDDFAKADPEVNLKNDAMLEKLYDNGGRILALAGTQKAVRGYSKPKTVVLDEAAQIEDATYGSTRPYLTGNPDCELIAVTTPYGKQGWFYKAWTESKNWHKILVKPAFKLSPDEREVIPDIPEEQFRAHWAALGVSAYYSPRHTYEFLKEELEEVGPNMWRQEYNCEFLDDGFSVFDINAIRDSITTSVTNMFTETDYISESGEYWGNL